MTTTDPTTLAARLVEIVNDPDGRWSAIYRVEAGAVLHTWGADAPFAPASLSDDDVRSALQSRILARADRPPSGPPMSRGALLDRLARMVLDLSDVPPAPVLALALRSVEHGAALDDSAVDRFLVDRSLAADGQLTDLGRRVLDIMDGAR